MHQYNMTLLSEIRQQGITAEPTAGTAAVPN